MSEAAKRLLMRAHFYHVTQDYAKQRAAQQRLLLRFRELAEATPFVITGDAQRGEVLLNFAEPAGAAIAIKENGRLGVTPVRHGRGVGSTIEPAIDYDPGTDDYVSNARDPLIEPVPGGPVQFKSALEVLAQAVLDVMDVARQNGAFK